MMKQILFFLLLLISIKLLSQEKDISGIHGNWIKYKIEMKDGSKLIDRFLTDSSYVNYSFRNKNMSMNGNPTHRTNEVCFPYSINRNFIKTSATSGYIIEIIKNDTLVLCEKISGIKDDKLKRFYFVRKEKLFNEIKEHKGTNKNQVANKFYTPTTKSNLIFKLNNAFNKNHDNFRLKGKIIIDIKHKRVQTFISYSSTSDSTKIKRIKKILNKTYKLWDIERFGELETLELPFVLKDQKTKMFQGFSMKFFTTSFYKLNNSNGGDLNLILKAGEYFSKAINAYQNKEYNKSIEYFSKSYELDPINIDALYNRAAIYYETGKIELACKDWIELSNLGQKGGIELLKKYCKKTTYNTLYSQ